ncbi:hypothetical protein DFP72DRAFT_47747 [Ephemerocybe angulata]|uniref:Uncharacterized protein n=1 Tax=Ephemerocybe angulata TaxID=980116 RepID=A0A8H6LVM2_9AGAR|nr:hypothetical protein DFP72DRAFT_47747 [Tulosesus angulatus]
MLFVSANTHTVESIRNLPNIGPTPLPPQAHPTSGEDDATPTADNIDFLEDAAVFDDGRVEQDTSCSESILDIPLSNSPCDSEEEFPDALVDLDGSAEADLTVIQPPPSSTPGVEASRSDRGVSPPEVDSPFLIAAEDGAGASLTSSNSISTSPDDVIATSAQEETQSCDEDDTGHREAGASDGEDNTGGPLHGAEIGSSPTSESGSTPTSPGEENLPRVTCTSTTYNSRHNQPQYNSRCVPINSDVDPDKAAEKEVEEAADPLEAIIELIKSYDPELGETRRLKATVRSALANNAQENT